MRQPVSANDEPQHGERRSGLPHFFVIVRLTVNFSFGRSRPQEPSFKSKVPFSGRVAHAETEWGSAFLLFPYWVRGCSIKHLLSLTLLDGSKWAEISLQKAQFCSGNSDPLFLNTLPHILHQVSGLAIQHITDFLQRIHG